MPDSIASAQYTIATHGYYDRFVSVNASQSAYQEDVRLDLTVRTWILSQLPEHNTFHLKIGEYLATGVTSGDQIQDKVFVSAEPKDDVVWHATHRPDKDAYTIERADDQTKGWTVLPEQSSYPHITLMEFNQDFTDQLFYFNPQ